MLSLPYELLYDISHFVELIDILHYVCINKYALNQMKDIFKKQIKRKKTYINTSFPQFIIDTMNGMHVMVFAPILKFQPKFEGSTGYLDNVEPSEVNYPIMIGVDHCRRSYITLKLKHHNSIIVEVFFQRYSSCSIKWIWTSNHGNNHLENYNGLFSKPSLYWGNIQGFAPSSLNQCAVIINDLQLKKNIKLLLDNKKYIIKRKLFSSNEIRQEKIEFAY